LGKIAKEFEYIKNTIRTPPESAKVHDVIDRNAKMSITFIDDFLSFEQ
jgi:hypothetical protein